MKSNIFSEFDDFFLFNRRFLELYFTISVVRNWRLDLQPLVEAVRNEIAAGDFLWSTKILGYINPKTFRVESSMITMQLVFKNQEIVPRASRRP